MYVLIVYDVAEERVNKFCKFLRRYLFWVQNSVFEGDLTKSQYFYVTNKLKEMVRERDCVIIYELGRKWVNRKIIGLEKRKISTIV